MYAINEFMLNVKRMHSIIIMYFTNTTLKIICEVTGEAIPDTVQSALDEENTHIQNYLKSITTDPEKISEALNKLTIMATQTQDKVENNAKLIEQIILNQEELKNDIMIQIRDFVGDLSVKMVDTLEIKLGPGSDLYKLIEDIKSVADNINNLQTDASS